MTTEYRFERREKIRQFLFDYLAQSRCMDCGEARVACLQLDHQTDKQYDMHRAVKNRISIDTLRKELAKCVVRCANCHAVKTAADQGWYRRLNASI